MSQLPLIGLVPSSSPSSAPSSSPSSAPYTVSAKPAPSGGAAAAAYAPPTVQKPNSLTISSADATQVDLAVGESIRLHPMLAPPSIDRPFANLHAGPIITDTYLEGSNTGENAAFLHLFLNPILRGNPRGDLILHEMKDLENRAHTVEALPSRVDRVRASEELAKNYKRELDSLAPGQRLVIPGGWIGSPAGHAMIYQFRREASGTFSLAVIDTGDRSHRGAAAVGWKRKQPSCILYNGIPKEALSEGFFSTVLSKQIPIPSLAKVEYDFDDVYDSLFLCFEPYKQKGNVVFSHPELFVTGQRGGTCAMKVLLAWLFLRMQEDEQEVIQEQIRGRVPPRDQTKPGTFIHADYKPIVFLVKYHSLLRFFHQNKNSLMHGTDAVDFDRRALLEEGLKSLQTMGSKRFRRRSMPAILPGDVLERSLTVLTHIRKQLAIATREIRKKQKRPIYIFTTKVIPPPTLPSKTPLQPQPILLDSPPFLSFENLNSSNLQDRLTACHKHITLLRDRNAGPEAIKHQVSLFTKELYKIARFSDLTENQLLTTLQKLVDLQALFVSFFQDQGTFCLSHEQNTNLMLFVAIRRITKVIEEKKRRARPQNSPTLEPPIASSHYSFNINHPPFASPMHLFFSPQDFALREELSRELSGHSIKQGNKGAVRVDGATLAQLRLYANNQQCIDLFKTQTNRRLSWNTKRTPSEELWRTAELEADLGRDNKSFYKLMDWEYFTELRRSFYLTLSTVDSQVILPSQAGIDSHPTFAFSYSDPTSISIELTKKYIQKPTNYKEQYDSPLLGVSSQPPLYAPGYWNPSDTKVTDFSKPTYPNVSYTDKYLQTLSRAPSDVAAREIFLSALRKHPTNTPIPLETHAEMLALHAVAEPLLSRQELLFHYGRFSSLLQDKKHQNHLLQQFFKSSTINGSPTHIPFNADYWGNEAFQSSFFAFIEESLAAYRNAPAKEAPERAAAADPDELGGESSGIQRADAPIDPTINESLPLENKLSVYFFMMKFLSMLSSYTTGAFQERILSEMKKLEDLIEELPLTLEQKSALHHIRLLAFRQIPVTKESLPSFLSSWLYAVNCKTSKNYIEAHEERLIKELAYSLLPTVPPDDLLSALNDTKMQTTLKELRLLLDIPRKATWLPNQDCPHLFHLVHENKALLSFNLLTGEIFNQTNELISFDLNREEILTQPIINQDLFTNTQGISFHREGLFVHFHAGDKEFRFPYSERSAIKNLEWKMTFRNEPPRWVRFYPKEILASEDAKNKYLMPDALIADHHLFVSLVPVGSQETPIYWITDKNFQVKFQLVHTPGIPPAPLKSEWNRVSSDASNPLVLSRIDNIEKALPSAPVLTRIERGEYTFQETLVDGKTFIVLPRYQSQGKPLRFRREGNDYLLDSDPRYRLVLQDEPFLLKDLNSYLLLENTNNRSDKLCLLPDLSYVPNEGKKLFSQLDGGHQLDVEDRALRASLLASKKVVRYEELIHPQACTRSYYTIPLDSSSHLEPVNLEQSLFAAYIYLGQKDYRKAMHHLKSINSSGIATSPEARALLQKIASLPGDIKDSSIYAKAVSLEALRVEIALETAKQGNLAPLANTKLPDNQVNPLEILLKRTETLLIEYLSEISRVPHYLRISSYLEEMDLLTTLTGLEEPSILLQTRLAYLRNSDAPLSLQPISGMTKPEHKKISCHEYYWLDMAGSIDVPAGTTLYQALSNNVKLPKNLFWEYYTKIVTNQLREEDRFSLIHTLQNFCALGPKPGEIHSYLARFLLGILWHFDQNPEGQGKKEFSPYVSRAVSGEPREWYDNFKRYYGIFTYGEQFPLYWIPKKKGVADADRQPTPRWTGANKGTLGPTPTDPIFIDPTQFPVEEMRPEDRLSLRLEESPLSPLLDQIKRYIKGHHPLQVTTPQNNGPTPDEIAKKCDEHLAQLCQDPEYAQIQETLRADIDAFKLAYREAYERKLNDPVYDVDENDLAQISSDLDAEMRQYEGYDAPDGTRVKGIIEINKNALLLEANNPPTDPVLALIYKADRESGSQKELHLSDLNYLFVQGNRALYRKMLPHFSDGEIDALYRQTGAFLLMHTEFNQLKRIQNAAQMAKGENLLKLTTRYLESECALAARDGGSSSDDESDDDVIDPHAVTPGGPDIPPVTPGGPSGSNRRREAIRRKQELAQRGLLSPDLAGSDTAGALEKQRGLALKELASAAALGTDIHKYQDNPAFLAFEYTRNLLFRIDPTSQVDALRLLMEKDENGNYVSSALQLPMGFGKTAIIIANILAERPDIPILITPAFQFYTVIGLLHPVLKACFNMDLIALNYHKEDLTLGVLTHIRDSLTTILEKPKLGTKTAVVVTPETMHLLELELQSLLQNPNPESLSDNDVQRLDLLFEIWSLFHTKGDAIGDEMQRLFDNNTETNVSMGQPQKVRREFLDLSKELFSTIATEKISISQSDLEKIDPSLISPSAADPAKEGHYLIKLDALIKLSSNRQKYLDSTLFKTIIAPKIALILATKYTPLGLQGSSEGMVKLRNRFARYVSDAMNGDIQKVVDQTIERDALHLRELAPGQLETNEEVNEDIEFVRLLRTYASPASSKEEHTKADLIALTKHLLMDVLGASTLPQMANVRYGRTKDPDFPGKAKPLLAGEESNNEFAYHYESAAFQLALAMHYGISKEALVGLAKRYHQNALTFIKSGLFTSYQETPPARFFHHLFNCLPDEATKNPVSILKKLKKNPKKTLEAEREIMEEFVSYYPIRLSANPISLFHQVRSFVAIGGTLDPYSLPMPMQQKKVVDIPGQGPTIVSNTHIDPLINASVVHAACRKATTSTVRVVSVENLSPEQKLAKMVKQHGSLPTIFDAGGLLGHLDPSELGEILQKMCLGLQVPKQAALIFSDEGPLLVKGGECTRLSDNIAADLSAKELVPNDVAIFYTDGYMTKGKPLPLVHNDLLVPVTEGMCLDAETLETLGTPSDPTQPPHVVGYAMSPELEQSLVSLRIDPYDLGNPSLNKIAAVTEAISSISPSPDALVQKLIFDHPDRQRITALLDVGGLFKDYDQVEIARSILRNLEKVNSPKKVVLFFCRKKSAPGEPLEEGDHFAFMRQGDTEPTFLDDTTEKELLKYGITTADFIAFYNKTHCVGTDLPMDPKALGIVSFDRDSLDDFCQTMMRFRKFLFDQELSFATLDHIADLFPTQIPGVSIKKLLEDQSITPQVAREALLSIMLEAIKTQTIRATKDSYRTYEKAIFDVARNLAMESLHNCYQEMKKGGVRFHDGLVDLLEIARGFSSVLFLETKDDPYAMFGSLSESVPTMTVLARHQRHILDELKTSLSSLGERQRRRVNPIYPIDTEALLTKADTEMTKIRQLAEENAARFAKEMSVLVQDVQSGADAMGGVQQRAVLQHQNQNQNKMIEQNQQLEQEFNSYQSKTYPKLNHYNSLAVTPDLIAKIKNPAFAPSIFMGSSKIGRAAGEPPASNTIIPDRYRPLFQENIYISERCLKPYQPNTSVLDLRTPPHKYLLFVEREDKSRMAIFVSQDEAKELKNYLLTHPEEKNLWLAMPSTLLLGGDFETFQTAIKEDAFQSILLEANIFAGHADYLIHHIGSYLQWLEAPATLPPNSPPALVNERTRALIKLKNDWLRLKGYYSSLDREIIETTLLDVQGIKDLLAGKDAFDRAISGIVPVFEKIEDYTDENCKFIPPERVREALPHQIPYLTKDEQLEKMLPSQLKYIRDAGVARRIPYEIIRELKLDDLLTETKDALYNDNFLLKNLLPGQYAKIDDADIIRHIPALNLPSIKPELTPYITDKDTLLGALSQFSADHIANLSPQQHTMLTLSHHLTLNFPEHSAHWDVYYQTGQFEKPTFDQLKASGEIQTVFQSPDLSQKLLIKAPEDFLHALVFFFKDDPEIGPLLPNGLIHKITDRVMIESFSTALIQKLSPAQTKNYLSPGRWGELLDAQARDMIASAPWNILENMIDNFVLQKTLSDGPDFVSRALDAYSPLLLQKVATHQRIIHALGRVGTQKLHVTQIKKFPLLKTDTFNQYDHLSPDQIRNFTLDMAAIVNEITDQELLKVVPLPVIQVMRNQVTIQRLPREATQKLSVDQIRTIPLRKTDTFNQYDHLSPDQVKNFTPDMARIVDHITDQELLKAVPQTVIQAIQNQVTIQRLPREATQKLSTDQIRTIPLHKTDTFNQYDHLSPDQVKAFTSDMAHIVDHITDQELLKAVPQTVIQAIQNQVTIQRLPKEGVEKLSPEQIRDFDLLESQYADLNWTQVQTFPPSKAHCVKYILNPVYRGALPPLVIQKIKDRETIHQLPINAVKNLLPTQIQKHGLSEGPNINQYHHLDGETQVRHLTDLSQIEHIKIPDLLSYVNPDVIRGIQKGSPLIPLLPTGVVDHLQDDALLSLPSYYLDRISVGRINQIDNALFLTAFPERNFSQTLPNIRAFEAKWNLAQRTLHPPVSLGPPPPIQAPSQPTPIRAPLPPPPAPTPTPSRPLPATTPTHSLHPPQAPQPPQQQQWGLPLPLFIQTPSILTPSHFQSPPALPPNYPQPVIVAHPPAQQQWGPPPQNLPPNPFATQYTPPTWLAQPVAPTSRTSPAVLHVFPSNGTRPTDVIVDPDLRRTNSLYGLSSSASVMATSTTGPSTPHSHLSSHISHPDDVPFSAAVDMDNALLDTPLRIDDLEVAPLVAPINTAATAATVATVDTVQSLSPVEIRRSSLQNEDYDRLSRDQIQNLLSGLSYGDKWTEASRIANYVPHMHNDDLLRVMPEDILRSVSDGDTLNRLPSAALQKLSDGQLLRLNETAWHRITAARLGQITDKTLLQRLTERELPHIAPNKMSLLSDAQIPKLRDRAQIRALSMRQTLHLVPKAQFKEASYFQAIAYTVSSVALFILNLVLVIPVEIGYLLTRMCNLRFFSYLHEAITNNFIRMARTLAYTFTCCKKNPVMT